MKIGLVMLNLFGKDQNIYIFEDNKSKQHFTATIKELPEVINELNESENLDFVELHGSPYYAPGIKEECLNYNTEYNKSHPLNIKIGEYHE